ncbi:MAG: hypothetical protein AB8C84_10830 [Oligoflexales bacterium]
MDYDKQEELQKIKEIQKISDAIDKIPVEMLSEEMMTLSELSSLTESIESMLSKHYTNTFPKTCHTCGTIYESLEDYQAKTKISASGRSSIFNKFGVQEFRNCRCGSTLVLVSGDRRDQSEYGEARRQLFDRCFDKIKIYSSDTDDEIRKFLRYLFRTGTVPKLFKK